MENRSLYYIKVLLRKNHLTCKFYYLQLEHKENVVN